MITDEDNQVSVVVTATLSIVKLAEAFQNAMLNLSGMWMTFNDSLDPDLRAWLLEMGEEKRRQEKRKELYLRRYARRGHR